HLEDKVKLTSTANWTPSSIVLLLHQSMRWNDRKSALFAMQLIKKHKINYLNDFVLKQALFTTCSYFGLNQLVVKLFQTCIRKDAISRDGLASALRHVIQSFITAGDPHTLLQYYIPLHVNAEHDANENENKNEEEEEEEEEDDDDNDYGDIDHINEEEEKEEKEEEEEKEKKEEGKEHDDEKNTDNNDLSTDKASAMQKSNKQISDYIWTSYENRHVLNPSHLGTLMYLCRQTDDVQLAMQLLQLVMDVHVQQQMKFELTNKNNNYFTTQERIVEKSLRHIFTPSFCSYFVELLLSHPHQLENRKILLSFLHIFCKHNLWRQWNNEFRDDLNITFMTYDIVEVILYYHLKLRMKIWTAQTNKKTDKDRIFYIVCDKDKNITNKNLRLSARIDSYNKKVWQAQLTNRHLLEKAQTFLMTRFWPPIECKINSDTDTQYFHVLTCQIPANTTPVFLGFLRLSTFF
ncbi:hypothetical protein RFI_17114, partial [Reticulomyxa filosa]